MTAPTPTVWEDLRRAADELELKIHLAGMEARDRWHALQPRLRRLEKKMEVKTAEASAWVAEELGNVSSALRELRDDVAARAKG